MKTLKNTLLFAGTALLLNSVVLSAESVAADGDHYEMQTHAAFFSAESHQPKILDPQVFVSDAAAQAGAGPQNIQHIAGVRPPLIDQDPGNAALLNAKGDQLGFKLADWLAAKGQVTITPAAGGKVEVSVQFSHLLPGGHYSLFENHFDQKPIGFTPLDGAGKANDFVAGADGIAKIVVTAPQALTKDNGVLLVYHSDKTSHGEQRGEIGVSAHHQIIARTGR